jgi:iron complex outermembrane recepter protein
MPNVSRWSRGLAVCAAALIAASAPAFAQDSEEIVITGSRIPTALDRDQPVVGVDADAIARTGLTATADVLQRLPIAGGGLNTRNNNSGNFGNPPDGGGVGAGAAEIDLRFLGSRRVLVLVDGLRWVAGASASGVPGSVDLNSIPQNMIERIEVLQEGASTLYGSDAIAGVVNIITRRSQDGLDASAQFGGYTEGDGYTRDYQLSFGAQSGRTSIVLGGGYTDQDGVLSADRPTTAFPTPFTTQCDSSCSSGTPNARVLITDPNTLNSLDITLRQALAPGVVPIYDPANPTGAATSYRAFTTADRFNFQPFNYVTTPSERLSIWGSVTHELTDHVSLRVRASYVNRQSANQAAPLPLFVGPDAGNGNLLDTISIDATNPFNPFGFTLEPGTLTFVGRRLVEGGPRHYAQDVDTWNVTGSLSGDFAINGRDMQWDVNALWSTNTANQTFTGNVNAQRVAQALGPVALCTAPCVPLNLFGGAGTITPAMYNFIGFTQHDFSEQELQAYTANLTGDIVDLPAGPLAFAVGYERRDVSGRFQPDALIVAGLGSDIPAQPTSGEFTVDEVYGELRVPLLADLPLVQELEASLAARWFDYSTFGSDSTYQAGLRWRPTSDVLVRASWAEGFRAPSIGESFGTASRFDQEVIDPCSDFLGLLPNGVAAPAAVQANCIALGVPANGSYVQLNPQLPVIVSGNAALTPETSESWNVGFVYRPSWAENARWADSMTFELNYADISLEDAIQSQSAGALLNRCAQTLDALACGTITRTASGAVAAINNPLINIGGIETQAVDFTVNWESPEYSFGRFNVTWYTSHLLEFTENVPTAAGLAPVSREGTERGSPDQAYPEWKSTVSVDWSRGEWGGTLTGRYISDVEETGAANTMDSIFYIDLQARYTPAWLEDRVVLSVGVNNVTDEDPPGCFTCGLNNFDPTTYDPPGTFAYFRVAYRD